MFSKDITENDAFLDMPLSTQALYFHLGMQADDDGFVSPNRILRMLGCQADDLKILVAKKFVLQFDDGVVVIKHWKMNNYLRIDRYKPTAHKDKMALLTVKENGGYKLSTIGIPAVDAGKDRLGKDRIGEGSIDTIVSEHSSQNKDIQEIFDVFYKTVNPTIQFQNKTQRNAAKELIKRLGKEKAIKAAQYAVTIQARGDKYCPRITTPVQLLNKHGELQVYYSQHSQSNVATI
jgi:hypothetical protein